MKITNILIVFILGITMHVNAQQVQHIDSKTFAELSATNEGVILDVRTPGEYSRGHIKGSTLIDVSNPNAGSKVSLLPKDKPIYIYCLTGSRSRAVANFMSQNGYKKIYNLTYGIIEWQRLGLPIVQSDAPVASTNKTYSLTEFNQLINSTGVVLVDFYAPWCGPCKKLSPIIQQIKQDFTGKAAVEKVDIEANSVVKNNYNIQSIPGLVLFKDGKEIWRHTGMITFEDLKKQINQHL